MANKRVENPSPATLRMRRWRANNPQLQARAVEFERKRRERLAAVQPCPVCGGPKKHTSTYCLKCRRGENHHRWKGAYKTADGYLCVYSPDEPGAQKNGYILEHRLVMQRTIGRPLFPNENVHHINGVRDDNRPENLELWVRWQPAGQRVEDVLAWALEVVNRYG